MIPISIDVVALYSCIPHEDALMAVETYLEERSTQQKECMPTWFLMEIVKMVLTGNTFEFDEQLYRQLVGIAMGMVAAPNIANLDMAIRDKFILDHSHEHIDRLYKSIWWRYIDDI